ncbi:nuclear transport factor 2 family protein [Stakelama tenebrarum]|uniref:Nuclear transport factor 2 family protein n=1 Tax=Stakelama tenebrarum TaxID=2711215 RepID=A0A6G6Y7N4_9SPHN|nr:nuclear transport factor 2 family protein [Sphingosinithalassobacter tenebrarum]QIG80807.1 nuclear transport factor 2 family protein [Sphingosinithalassobacter tenebrarum]
MALEPQELEAIHAREMIRDCVARVARGEDRRDRDLLKTAYWPGAAMDYGIFAGDLDAYLDWIVPGSPAVLLTQHFIGQTLIAVEGDTAKAESHVIAYHRVDYGSEHRDLAMGGRYLDSFEKRDGQWRIAARTMLYDWSQDIGQAADFSEGLMGAPFSAGHFTGRTTGDFSAEFFGKALEGTK